MDRLEHALAKADRRESRVAVLFLDLDNFKVVNDSLSHEAGDSLHVAVAERLKACLRTEDTLTRFGGGEFTILLEGVEDVSEATQVAERIIEESRRPFVVEGCEVFATPSIGVALSASSHDRPEDLLRDADVAMYRAEEEGRQATKYSTPVRIPGL